MNVREKILPNIRAATSEDVPRLLELYRELDEVHRSHHPELFPSTIIRERAAIEAMIIDPKAGVLVAEVPVSAGAAIAGFVRVLDAQTPAGPVLLSRRFGLVDELVTASEYRRTGVASALLDAAEVWARERGIPALEVTVWGFNHAAQDLYADHGYSVLRHYFRKPLPG